MFSEPEDHGALVKLETFFLLNFFQQLISNLRFFGFGIRQAMFHCLNRFLLNFGPLQVINMNHDIFLLLKHILIRKDIILDDITIVFRQVVNKLLGRLVLQSIGHLVCVDPIATELLTLLLYARTESFGLDFL